jgi:molecular chaperone DnaK (HSP70)
LLEDEDFHRDIKRAEFEEMVTPIIERLTKILEEAWQLAGKYLFKISMPEWNLLL